MTTGAIAATAAVSVLTIAGSISAAAFFMRGSTARSQLAEAPSGDALMQLARLNPLYHGPGAVFDNPLYQENVFDYPDRRLHTEGVISDSMDNGLDAIIE